MKTNPVTGLSGQAPDASINPLVFDLLDWLAAEPRPYAEVMEAWRTSGPRLTIWEDAVDLGWVIRRRDLSAAEAMVRLTAEGRQALQTRSRSA